MEEIRGKHLLLDTNLLIYNVKNEEIFTLFFERIFDLNVKSVIDQTIKFEFLRGCTTQEDLQAKQEYLDLLLGSNRMELPVDKSVFEKARLISNIYSRKNIKYAKQISFGDCLIAAQMIKYNSKRNELFIATTDNSNFPTFIFNRVDVITLHDDNNIFNIGIYSINQKIFNLKAKDFDN
jgi:predicted nucleic acid-binding protein